jgi:hypothetical protein
MMDTEEKEEVEDTTNTSKHKQAEKDGMPPPISETKTGNKNTISEPS